MSIMTAMCTTFNTNAWRCTRNAAMYSYSLLNNNKYNRMGEMWFECRVFVLLAQPSQKKNVIWLNDVINPDPNLNVYRVITSTYYWVNGMLLNREVARKRSCTAHRKLLITKPISSATIFNNKRRAFESTDWLSYDEWVVITNSNAYICLPFSLNLFIFIEKINYVTHLCVIVKTTLISVSYWCDALHLYWFRIELALHDEQDH